MKPLLVKLLVGIAAFGVTTPSRAAIIVSLEPSSQAINVGNTAAMDLVVSGLGNLFSPSLGAFAFDLSYNPAILSAFSLTFGNSLDMGVLGSSRFSDITISGVIHLDEVSFEDPTDLNNAQANNFTLATLKFTGLAPGTSAIDFTSGSLSDETGLNSLQFATSAGSVKVMAVPEPATYFEGIGALLMLGWFGWKNRN